MLAQLKQLFQIYSRDRRCLVPLGICANGAIFGQGLSAPGTTLEQQTRGCFGLMRDLVEKAGASLANVGRVTAYVLAAEDREPTYAIWDEMFPDPADRPAFKVLTGPLPAGQKLRLDVIAIAGGRRRRIDIAGVEARDPTVAIEGWLFTSRLHGIVPATGKNAEGLGLQIAAALANARRLMELSGVDDLELAQLTTFGLSDEYKTEALLSLQAGVNRESSAPALNVLESWVRPGTHAMVEAIGIGRAVGKDFRELYLSPEKTNQPAGLKFGSLVHAPSLAPTDNGTDVESQLRSVLAGMDRLLDVAGCGRGEVVRCSFYMHDLKDRPVLNNVWQEWYPEPQDRPPHTYVPADLPEGQLISLEVIALAGSKRRVLSVPGVEHGDPMSLGAVNENLLVTSRIFGGPTSGRDDPPDVHAAKCFETANALLEACGAGPQALQQLTVFASSPEYMGPVEQLLAEASKARLDFLETDLGRRVLLPRLQLLALV